jgi:hypothetical protein
MLPMSAVRQTKSPPGPAGRWFVDRLKQMPVETGKVPKLPVTKEEGETVYENLADANVNNPPPMPLDEHS